ncbi:MAG: NAD(+)/NADH kinase, partial [Candidatus Omnitrophota bacterium]|nr:NAD(+)/NADH kinase [Candidatus Omnitrophota bacterium]
MAHRPRILVVYKKDAYRQFLQEQQDPRLARLLHHGHPDVVDMQQAHRVHEGAMEAVVHALRQLPVEVELAYRATLKVTRRYDLVVSVGGDGTFLHAARSIQQAPILGVNSDPARSEAVFCAATRRTFAHLVRQALAGPAGGGAGRLPALRLYRLQLRLNGKRLPQEAINDVLVAHDDPATMTRYRLGIGRRVETHKSSGLWVATAAGSSSAVMAAGGVRLPWGGKRFQYRPRELYRGRLSRYRLTGGVLSAQTRVRVTWLMRRGAAFLDGPHVKIPLHFADQLEIRLSL